MAQGVDAVLTLSVSDVVVFVCGSTSPRPAVVGQAFLLGVSLRQAGAPALQTPRGAERTQ